MADGASAADAASAEVVARPDVHAGTTAFNRDLAWLEFNRRVLALAQDERTPLLERVRFLAIFSSNLDEFVMKRLGLLARRIELGRTEPDQDGVPAPTLLASLRRTISDLQHEQQECYEACIRPALEREGIELLEYERLGADEKRWLRKWFRKNVFPTLTPLAVDPGHRFPFISNQSRNLGILLAEPELGTEARPASAEHSAGHASPLRRRGQKPGEALFARVKVPDMLTQWVRLPEDHSDPGCPAGASRPTGAVGRGRFVNLRDIITENLDDLFPGMQIVEIVPFRVLRDSEGQSAEPSSEGDLLIERVEDELRMRRFAAPVRMEICSNPSPRVLGHLAQELKLDQASIDQREGLLDYTILNEIADLDRPELRWPKWTAVVPPRLAEARRDIFSVIRQGDVLVHHPFDSFEASATRFIAEAARDPDVLAIKQTIYRTSRESPFVASLIRAAESGKQVAVLVELRARFDEQSNMKIARALEKAGAHVAYGVMGFKTHCKAALVVRREADGLRSYAHLGTGNYNPKTAMLYTDLGLFTCDPMVTDDVIELFNLLTGRSRLDTYETLLVAPVNMKKRFIEMIDREAELARLHAAGKSPVGGRIVAKMNSLADPDVNERLYAASQAGVQITLFVRGFCTLRPRVPGLSEGIRVFSVLGRFLEHSRIFHFGAGHADPLEGEWYIASADWMYRNLNNRVESATPVNGRGNRAKLLRIIEIMSADCRGAWELNPDGTYTQRAAPVGAPEDSPEMLGTFEAMMREARGA
ncbi:MAG: polyphosphate kinase 1 [Phycisphaeraceae bacterium]|nr:polyphosphate kinase 1 [Phycisphaeraceae bacterium]